MKCFWFSLLLFCCAWPASLWAQPSPCGQPELMTPTCAEACIVCDIDGFTGINSSTAQGVAPPGFCTTQWHNIQWIAFLAGSTNLSLRVSVSNCQDGPGLEIGIYRSLDCKSFQKVSNCDTDVPNNTSQIFTNTVPLQIGQYYYLVMDGSEGDICNYLVEVVSGTTFVADLVGSGEITGAAIACQNEMIQYSTPGVDGAAHWDWTLDGKVAGQGKSIDLTWDTPGTYQLCMTASNACDIGTPTCQTVEVYESPLVFREEQICTGDCLVEGNDTICSPGTYAFLYQTEHGCDSIVSLKLSNFSPALLNLDLVICQGDTFSIEEQDYTSSGSFEQIIPTQNGCDSTIYLDLQVIECNIQGNVEAASAKCPDTETGSLQFSIETGTAPFTYHWERIGFQTPAGNGTINTLGELVQIGGLPKGDYLIQVDDGFGNTRVLLAEVSDPPPIAIALQPTDHNGFAIACFGGQGDIAAQASGGNPAYTYQWSNNAQGPLNAGLAAGHYTVTVTDANGCSQEQSLVLEQPPLLLAGTQIKQPDCSAPASGHIEASLAGGVQPYTIYLNGNLSKLDEWDHLPGGVYTLRIVDANGCESTLIDTLREIEIPVIDAGMDLSVELGTEVTLDLWSAGLLEQITWSPSDGLSCSDCPDPTLSPLGDITYVVVVTSRDGCTATDSIRLRVSKNPQVFVPDGFSPNGDGTNDVLTLFANVNVEEVISFKVFSRWGAEVFEAVHFPPNDPQIGWDGRFQERPMNPAVFSWTAEVKLFDGQRLSYSGDTTLIR